jgi:hypothetical protein
VPRTLTSMLANAVFAALLDGKQGVVGCGNQAV